jgi:energy-coupling factor transporter ATP-binding protein EcfA2
MASIIEIENYTWQYLNSSKPALEPLSLQINEGEFVGIIGPNGSGKTTLALSMDGLIPGQYHGIKQGEVRVKGKEVEEYESGALQRFIGMVFSDPESQFTAMTVEDELVFGMENLGMTVPEIRERLEWVTELTDLAHLLEKPPYEISGGQKQRVALAAVLAMQPEIMILDEPTSMLDPISRVRVFDVLARLREEGGRTIIVIEHSLENLVPLTDRMVLLHNGQLILDDKTEPFFENTDLLLERGVFPPEVTQFFHWLAVDGKYAGELPLNLEDAAERLQRLVQK